MQTPQYYANTEGNRVAAASWAQQALFFGAIARGKDGLDAVFCCGTNVLFRRTAFESVGGFPTNSLTEDFELSIHLHEKGWKSAYLPDVLSRGLGPEDMAAYVSQQQRWARGCLSGLPRALRARLPWRLKLQYLLSASYFLSGWTVLIYMSFPVVRLLFGGQPLAGIDAPEFLLHFAPYFAIALTTAALAGRGRVHLRGLRAGRRQLLDPRPVHGVHGAAPQGLLRGHPEEGRRGPPAGSGDARARGASASWSRSASTALSESQDAATINNVSFAAVPRLGPDDRAAGRRSPKPRPAPPRLGARRAAR